MLFESLCVFLASFSFGLVMFALGQVLMLVLPGCPGEEVTLRQFPALGWKPLLTLALVAVILAVVCALMPLYHWFG